MFRGKKETRSLFQLKCRIESSFFCRFTVTVFGHQPLNYLMVFRNKKYDEIKLNVREKSHCHMLSPQQAMLCLLSGIFFFVC